MVRNHDRNILELRSDIGIPVNKQICMFGIVKDIWNRLQEIGYMHNNKNYSILIVIYSHWELPSTSFSLAGSSSGPKIPKICYSKTKDWSMILKILLYQDFRNMQSPFSKKCWKKIPINASVSKWPSRTLGSREKKSKMRILRIRPMQLWTIWAIKSKKWRSRWRHRSSGQRRSTARHLTFDNVYYAIQLFSSRATLSPFP